MSDPVRQEIAATSKTVVVKVGTRVLTHEDGTLDQERVTAIAEQDRPADGREAAGGAREQRGGGGRNRAAWAAAAADRPGPSAGGGRGRARAG